VTIRRTGSFGPGITKGHIHGFRMTLTLALDIALPSLYDVAVVYHDSETIT
jgi:hypothetical protein